MPGDAHKPVTPFWRWMAGLLAFVALAFAALRFYYLARLGVSPQGPGMLLVLRVLFPLLIGLFFGYVAITGRIPGTSSANK